MTKEADLTDAGSRGTRIALVDDDPVFLRVFAANLDAAGYQTVCFDDPKRALASLQRGVPPAACVLDWDMPGIDGLELFKRLRARGVPVPVLFLTAHGQPIFEEAALDAGAVDFVDKSRGPAIILQRLSLALRRHEAPGTAQSGADQPDMEVGELTVSQASKRASWRGHAVPLSRNEFDVVALLAETAGRDISYRQIYDVVRGNGFIAGQGEDGYRANVRAMVKRIRHKFVQLDPGFEALRNYPGFGYRWDRDA